MEIKGYTLHGDYYLADKVIPNKTWKEACEIKEEITLPNGKTVVARTLSKKELKTIPENERGTNDCWYWTSTPCDSNLAWTVYGSRGFDDYNGFNYSDDYGGVRLGFKNPF